jgi:hypothetical protein
VCQMAQESVLLRCVCGCMCACVYSVLLCINTSMCAHMCVCTVSISVRSVDRKEELCVSDGIRKCTTKVCMWVCAYMHVRIDHICVCMHVRIDHIYVCMHMYVYTCMYTYTYIHTQIYI